MVKIDGKEIHRKMKIGVFAAIKGGVGKTTLTFNFGEWLASRNQNVLLIDADSQCSLTQTYNIYQNQNTIEDIFLSDPSQIVPADNLIKHIHKNLDLIPGSVHLDTVEASLQTKINKEMKMYMWMSSNYETLKKYDYVLVDCHPDFSVITVNMLVIADAIFSPLEPSEYSFDSKALILTRFKLLKRDLVSPIPNKKGTYDSYITAKLYFIGNRIKYNTASSHDFINNMKSNKQMIGFIPEKELWNKTTLFHKPISSMQQDKKVYSRNRQFFDDLNATFNRMKGLLSD